MRPWQTRSNKFLVRIKKSEICPWICTSVTTITCTFTVPRMSEYVNSCVLCPIGIDSSSEMPRSTLAKENFSVEVHGHWVCQDSIRPSECCASDFHKWWTFIRYLSNGQGLKSDFLMWSQFSPYGIKYSKAEYTKALFYSICVPENVGINKKGRK